MFFAVAEQAVTLRDPDGKPLASVRFAVNPANTALVEMHVNVGDTPEQVVVFDRQGLLKNVTVIEPPKNDPNAKLVVTPPDYNADDDAAARQRAETQRLADFAPSPPTQPFSPAPANVTPPTGPV